MKIFNDVPITTISAEGKAVAKINDKVAFIKGGVPGDIADVKIFKNKKNFMEGEVLSITQPSEYRTHPECTHFGVCGGCKWQNMAYSQQLKQKENQIKEAFERIGHLDFDSINPIIPAPDTFYYRNKLEFTFSNNRWLTTDELNQDNITDKNALGFHVPGRFDKILDIEHCYLQNKISNDIRLSVKNYALDNKLSFYDLKQHHGFLRNLIIRSSTLNEIMVILCVTNNTKEVLNPLIEHLVSNFPEITSLNYVVNTKKNDTIADLNIINYSGKSFIQEKIDNLLFNISPKSFFQTNSKQCINLYRKTAIYANLQGDELVYDLYTGTGTIANYIASNARQVIGIEYVEEAVKAAAENSRINNIHNTQFFSGDLKDVLNEEFLLQHGKPEVIITDPPRAGMHPGVVAKLLEIKADKIIYISCNPATHARDLALMSDDYKITDIQPIDMFPHTHHIENIVSLKLIEAG